MTILKKLSVNKNSAIALMSIKPIYAEKLMKGLKKYEFRKTAINKNLKYIIIYSTSPQKQIIGIADVKEVHSSSPDDIWEKTKSASGISFDAYKAYFQNKKKAYAIEIKNVFALSRPIDIKEMGKKFKAPQSFRYADHIFLKKVLTISEKVNSNNLFLIGGIHGVGKSTLCKEISNSLNLEYLSASELIKGFNDELNKKDHDRKKNVKNIKNNQNILVSALQEIIDYEEIYLLDGHFTLLDGSNQIKSISVSVFRSIKPKAIFILCDKPTHIAIRLRSRDGFHYDINLLNDMQKREIRQAKLVGRKLNIKVHVIYLDDVVKIKKILMAANQSIRALER